MASQPPTKPSIAQDGELPRVLGPFDAVMLVVGSIIGSGIFLKVSNIDSKVGSFSAIMAVWIIGGIATLCASLSLAELAAMLPHAGGPYVYLREAYGRLTAFLWGWAEFSIIRTGSLGSLACGTVIYLNEFLESMMRANNPSLPAEYSPLSHWTQCAVTIAAVSFLTWINVIGTRWAARTQNITAVIKLTFLMALGQWNFDNLQPIAPPKFSLDFVQAFGLAMVAVFWPYDGWINIGPMAEEVKEPKRNVPLGLGLGVLVVTLVYCGANVGYHFCLPLSETQKSNAIAADVFGAIFGQWGVALASAGVMISMFGALNSNLLAGPRIYFAMARDGLFPRNIGHVHGNYQTPSNAVLAQSIWSIIQILIVFGFTPNPKGAFDMLTDFVVLAGTIFYGLVVGAVIVLRFRLPKLDRPYATWGYPLTPLFYLGVALLVVGSVTVDSVRGWFVEDPDLNRIKIPAVAALMLIGVGLYGLFRSLEGRSK
jgi:APA family basic amino acid/polyamine antiporter